MLAQLISTKDAIENSLENSPMIAFDWTLNVGHILTVAGMIIGGVTVMVRIRDDVRSMQTTENKNAVRLDALEDSMKALTEATVSIARQDERLNAIEHRLGLLEHAPIK